MSQNFTLNEIIKELYYNLKPVTKEQFKNSLNNRLAELKLEYSESHITNTIRDCNLVFTENNFESTKNDTSDSTKTQLVNRNGETYKRSPKAKNKIQGRSSDAIIEARRECCLNLYNKNPNVWSKKTFYAAYKKSLREADIPVPSQNTLRNDIKSCNIIFKNNKLLAQHTRTTLNTLGYEFGFYIRQIRVICKSHDKVIYTPEKLETGITKEQLYTTLERIIDASKNTDDPDKKLTTKKSISKHTLVHVYIILKEKGMERYFADKIDISSPHPKDFLYIETHDYCTKVVFEYRNFDTMLDKIYEIISHIPIEE